MRPKPLLLALMLTAAFQRQGMAQADPAAQGARSAALGGCFLGLSDGWAQGATMDTTARFCAALDYAQHLHRPEMADKQLALRMALGSLHGAALAAYCHTGDALYHRQQLAAALNVGVAPRVTVGVGGWLVRHASADPHYDPISHLGAAALAKAEPWQGVSLGLMAYLPADEPRRVGARASLSYQPATQWIAVVEADCATRLDVAAGIEYTLMGQFVLRAGFSTLRHSLTFGFAWQAGRMGLHLAAASHPALGLSPHLSAHYAL